MSGRNDKNIYTYYSDYKEFVDCVYEVAPPNVKSIYTKKWGPYLKGCIYSNWTETDERLFQNANE